ncbi:hypothetical protein AAZX31_19G028100 [Glycine max]|uniref:Malonyl-CoA:isoflavone 7-O-glucoside-6''-O-malonyltransferase n=3 Tax=Glycine subgen. Soja TaxID=1462606 RepID=A7BID0_SOYBN|nr:malonyl-CoA:isoflavone 7-O-glucoside-6''-O-malonyltransferase [Glycine max]XP_028215970.1 phenolic glucoside malonyltransferase 1-like [Glycine soja]KAG4911718.1 hypothetical protein JHK86_052151 [Glycine max]KAG5082160.1 hypothetical protein JHK84_052198 [Glycine max]KAG5084925.1 hypothetical protein JHK82_052322 [Glycine max]RZB46235.1 Phenolic glucoside malonyltransferase 2 [Glycine soja]BAF73621.1 malonyl-CoA:isoflavone 7-O-glucoside-6''-O-malonyltransferase [Glycine max]|eukprot:NP_001236819.1 malonyl-CoA:isoflavone 7-O-glucoside-6''-O-malonyltransferase [Glycine max]
MAESPTFKVHEVCSISPPQETPPTTLPFTLFDVLWLRFPPVERLFFYSFPNPTTTSFFDTTVLPNLKHSLSLTLHHFPPLAGTITWPNHSPLPLITYTPGNTIPFTIAQSNADFNTLSSNLSQVNHHLQNLIPHLTISHEEASVLALQLTLFPNQGFSIGITTHHAALDGKSSTLFIKSWAHFCSQLNTSPEEPLSLPKHLIPSFDRSVIRDTLGIGEIYANSWMNFGGATNDRSLNVWDSLGGSQTDLVKGLFELTPLDIKKLKKLAESKVVVGDNKKKIRVTSFTVTCAYLLSCAVKAEQPNCERVPFIFSVDCRARLDPPIPGTYFGNSVVSLLVIAKREELLGEEAFFKSVLGISEELNRIEGDVLNGADRWMPKIQSVMSERPRLFSVAGSPRFEVYDVDFGWGRPKKVDVTSVDKTGAFSLSETRDHSGGIQIGLALTKSQMEAFSTVFAQGLESLE